VKPRVFQLARCLAPAFDGALLSIEWREALWARFFPAAPQRQSDPSSNTEWSSEPESAFQALRRQSEDCRQVEEADLGGRLADGPKEPKSTVLSIEKEAIIVAFRKHTLLPLNDCLYSLQATIPYLTRSSLHPCLQRHDDPSLPEVKGDMPVRKKFKPYPIGYFHIDIAEVQTAKGKLYLYVPLIARAKVSPDLSSFRTVFRETCRSRALSLLILPLMKCSRLIRAIVSTTSDTKQAAQQTNL
jgi:hypothetical protein